jgi:hypothetical protein
MAITNIRPASYEVASRGVTPADLDAGLAGKQNIDASLTDLIGLNGPGLVEQTDTNSFTNRTVGTVSGDSVLTRDDGDARYARSSDIPGITYNVSTLQEGVETHSGQLASLMSLQFGRPGDAPQLFRSDLASGEPFI